MFSTWSKLFLVGLAILWSGGTGCIHWLFDLTPNHYVGERECPDYSIVLGGPPPKAYLEVCVTARTAAYQSFRGAYRSWAPDGTLRTEGQWGTVAYGTWNFFSSDGTPELTCDCDAHPIECTELKPGAADRATAISAEYQIGSLGALVKHASRVGVNMVSSAGELLERRLYSMSGTLVAQCPPDKMWGYHNYTQGRPSHLDYDVFAYCMNTPGDSCPPDSSYCARYTGLHCEVRGDDRECVPDAPFIDGLASYWNFGRELAEQGHYQDGVKVGEWKKFFEKQIESTSYGEGEQVVMERVETREGKLLLEVRYKDGSFQSRVELGRDDLMVHVDPLRGSRHGFKCTLKSTSGEWVAEGPCSTPDPAKADVLKQGNWKEMVNGKRRKLKYVDGVSERDRKEAERQRRAEEKAERARVLEEQRERSAAIARGDCMFDGYEGAECELRLCAKIAKKVRSMQPNSSCFAGEPLDSYRGQWGDSIHTINTFAGVLKQRGDLAGFNRLISRVKKCKTPPWFRSCSN